jgi:hypothetical protein
MQMHLLRCALRRRPEFECFSCPMEVSEILQALKREKISVALLSFGNHENDENMLSIIRRTHLTHECQSSCFISIAAMPY